MPEDGKIKIAIIYDLVMALKDAREDLKMSTIDDMAERLVERFKSLKAEQ